MMNPVTMIAIVIVARFSRRFAIRYFLLDWHSLFVLLVNREFVSRWHTLDWWALDEFWLLMELSRPCSLL
jgi:hypothetical protein